MRPIALAAAFSALLLAGCGLKDEGGAADPGAPPLGLRADDDREGIYDLGLLNKVLAAHGATRVDT